MAKVLYDFAGQRENELSIVAGELVEIVQKESNGKFFVGRLDTGVFRELTLYL
jgi:hypothetical protein